MLKPGDDLEVRFGEGSVAAVVQEIRGSDDAQNYAGGYAGGQE